jgi:phospholipase/lecithinase/hemolysin
MRVAARAQICAALLPGLATVSLVNAQQFSRFVVLGDSSVDSGFYRKLTNPGGGGMGGTSAFAAVVSTFSQHRATNFGGQVGINVAPRQRAARKWRHL